jgi:hypothetical protein
MLGSPKSRRLRRMIALGPEESFEAESTRAPTPTPTPASNCNGGSKSHPTKKTASLGSSVRRPRRSMSLGHAER